jgi:undecaprenyl-diphosphatase
MSQIDSVQAAFLGLVQGLTEFLPVSSSGHLVVFQHLLGLRSPELLFDVVLHGGTLLAVLVVFGRDLWKTVRESLLASVEMARKRSVRAVWRQRAYLRLAACLVIGTVPAGVAGLLFQDALEEAFGSVASVGGTLLVTGTVLYGTRLSKGHGRDLEHLRLRDSLLIGIAQAVALLPGISRSGMTIAAGLFCGLRRDLAARFSFLLSVPAILGAHLLQAYEARESLTTLDMGPFLIGGVFALITGYVALRLLLRVVDGGRLFRFAYYCWALGVSILLAVWMGPGQG